MNKMVVDAHCDTLGRLVDEACDFSELKGGHLDLERLARSPVAVQFFALFAPPSLGAVGGLRRLLLMVEAFHRMVSQNSGRLKAVLSRHDLEADGRVGAMLSLEGCDLLGEDLGLVDLFGRLGVRSAMLTWNQRNRLADGALEQGSGGGLSDLGRRAVQCFEKAHILPDVSHLSQRGVDDVLEVAGGPVIASHSCAAAVYPHPRNLEDAQIRALAAKGGVVGLTFYTRFLNGQRHGTWGDLFRHLDHLVAVAGEEAVGFGSDFDGMEDLPEGLSDICGYGQLLSEMRGRGYSEELTGKIAGGNFRRVLERTLPGPEGGVTWT